MVFGQLSRARAQRAHGVEGEVCARVHTFGQGSGGKEGKRERVGEERWKETQGNKPEMRNNKEDEGNGREMSLSTSVCRASGSLVNPGVPATSGAWWEDSVLSLPIQSNHPEPTVRSAL